jgi:putative sugar O-methyltransferase
VPVSAAIRADSLGWRKRCDNTLAWLERFGRPLGSFPAYIQESEFVWPEAVGVVEGRRLSIAFLYHLCIAAQIDASAGKVGSVLELGSGYGGLARILKLLNPGANIVLCDLPTTLFFCYVYLRRHFPHATFEVIERPEQPRGNADFTFVPAPLARNLAGSTFDLFANTSSLSGMRRPPIGICLIRRI